MAPVWEITVVIEKLIALIKSVYAMPLSDQKSQAIAAIRTCIGHLDAARSANVTPLDLTRLSVADLIQQTDPNNNIAAHAALMKFLAVKHANQGMSVALALDTAIYSVKEYRENITPRTTVMRNILLFVIKTCRTELPTFCGGPKVKPHIAADKLYTQLVALARQRYVERKITGETVGDLTDWPGGGYEAEDMVRAMDALWQSIPPPTQ